MHRNKSLRLAGCFFSFLLICLVCPSSVTAEMVVLKSGRTLEGQVFEKGDGYVKIQTDTGTFKVKEKQIERMGESLADGESSFGDDDVDVEALLEEVAEKLSDQEWKERMEAYGEYFKAVFRFQDQYMNIRRTSVDGINKAMAKKKTSEAFAIGRKCIGQMMYVQQEFNKLEVFPELSSYHEKVAEALNFVIKSMKAWLVGDQHIYYRYNKDSIKAMIASMEQYAEFARILWVGERQDFYMDKRIDALKKMLGEKYY